jgi:predicted GIY-YIG superfamily endonuclease
MSTSFNAEDPRPHFVYWVYDGADQLLYVGCARDVAHRIYLHTAPSTRSETSRQIRARMARYESDEYPTKAEARDAEREAIRVGLPLLNKQHNPRYRKGDGMRYYPASDLANTA